MLYITFVLICQHALSVLLLLSLLLLFNRDGLITLIRLSTSRYYTTGLSTIAYDNFIILVHVLYLTTSKMVLYEYQIM
jgi:hypothetical protein